MDRKLTIIAQFVASIREELRCTVGANIEIRMEHMGL